MKKIKCKWVGPVFDVSGYASATRSYINALIELGTIDLSVSCLSFENEKTTFGEFDQKIQPLLNRDIGCKIQIIHLTPENYPTVYDRKFYNIGYTAWETSRVPEKWVSLCNQMQEIWVPSEWNKGVFSESGVRVPIYVIPHGIQEPHPSNENRIILDDSDNCFIFYSIFQWIARKNPEGLLKAYLTEFSPSEKVSLVLKTYRLNCSPREQEIIKTDILSIKKGLNLESYPPIHFFGGLLSHDYMASLHHKCDCFVLPHRGEGFGIPMAEAMSYGNPVISTRYSGNLQFMNDENSYLISCQETPVFNMLFSNYNGRMVWAEPDVMHLRRLMRFVYQNRDKAREKGMIGQRDIKNNFSWEKIGTLIYNRLRQILEEIRA